MTLAAGTEAPDFTLKDSFGKEFKLSEFKNKIVVLEWMNQQCPVSHGHHEKQTMQKTYKKAAFSLLSTQKKNIEIIPQKNIIKF